MKEAFTRVGRSLRSNPLRYLSIVAVVIAGAAAMHALRWSCRPEAAKFVNAWNRHELDEVVAMAGTEGAARLRAKLATLERTRGWTAGWPKLAFGDPVYVDADRAIISHRADDGWLRAEWVLADGQWVLVSLGDPWD